MSVTHQSWTHPSPWRERLIASRAGRIADPSDRLRYLRTALAPRPRPGLPFRCHGPAFTAASLLLALLFSPSPTTPDALASRSVRAATTAAPGPLTPVWLVETSPGVEVWSNGLRVETRFETTGPARSYQVFDAASESRAALGPASRPAGIVFHSTESLQAPFEEGQNRRLQRLGENLLHYVRQKRAYNYVIDRFGRVWRVVPDHAAANHAGFSVWGANGLAWVNLNRSFLGVSLEAATGGDATPSAARLTPAQVHAVRTLTEMLRARYAIPAENCVAHAQVSVAAAASRLGNHVDWIRDFPFALAGLPDNYARPPAAVAAFGLDYTNGYAGAAEPSLGAALRAAEESLAREAAARGLTLSQWRSRLQRRFRDIRAALQEAAEEEHDE